MATQHKNHGTEESKHATAVAEAEPPLLTDKLAPPLPTQLAAPTDLSDLVDPDAILGTRFGGPLMSGALEDGAAGICLLGKRAKITAATGAFSGLPIKFPASSILINLVTQIQQTFNGVTPKLNIGTTPGGLDIATIDLTVAPTQLNTNLSTILGSSWTVYLSLAITGATTQGKATTIIFYSVPALTRPS